MRSLAEISFRLKQGLANCILWIYPPSPGVTNIAAPLPGLPHPASIADTAAGSAWASELCALADRILCGRLPLLGMCIETGPEPAWRRDYLSGKESPPILFLRIPYLHAVKVGDHKNIWELNRHQHLVLVAQAFAVTKNSDYSRFVTGQLRHWWRENPPQCGINWASGLEVAFRALSWIWIFHLAGTEMDAAFRKEFLAQLYRHGLHLEYNLSLYFSPNTHLLGEALALHAIGWLFPQFPRSEQWKRRARTILLGELGKQVHRDGSHFEQSTYYHVYALDMFLFHHTLEPLPETGPLAAMAEFLAAVIGADGALPFLGDDDGGRLFHPFGPRRSFARATLATCSVLLGREYCSYDDRDLLDQASWWIGPRQARAATPVRFVQLSQYFPQSGLVSMRSDDIRVLVDGGSFGPGSGGHSHSDTLSLIASAGDVEILIDPGTFTYVGDPEWRDYFRGSAAHNTIRINGRDQADPAGPFRWLNKPDAEVLSWKTGPELDEFEAACSYAGVRHRRHVLFTKQERLLTITDVIEGQAADCLIEQFWHAGGFVTETRTDRVANRRWRIGERAELTVDARAASEVLEGWRSDSPGSKRAAPVIRVWVRMALPVELKATLRISAPGT
jgi:hypothetical protein